MRTQPTTSSSPDRLLYVHRGLLVITLLLISATQVCSGAYYGKLIGKLSELHHGVSGEVYAVDGRTIYLKDFTYDGEAPAAYFYVGTSKNVNGNGIRLRDEHGTTELLKRYRRKGITLTLPEGKTLNNFKWFSVWCDEFSVNFGDVKIPRGFDYPKPQKLGALNGIHGVSSEPVVVVDAQTLLVPGFSYDGEAPDAKFWVGAGPSPSPQGIRVPDENGKEEPLRRYDRKTIVLTLPGDLTVHQLGHFGVWCEAFAVDFGHVQIPLGLNVPPSLKMLGVSPQNVHRGGQGQTLTGLGLQNFLREFPSSTSLLSSSSSPGAGSVLQYQIQRPTTYRPILQRRDDRADGRQQIDYRTAKSLQQTVDPQQLNGPSLDPTYSSSHNPSQQTVLFEDRAPSVESANVRSSSYQHQHRQQHRTRDRDGSHSADSHPFSYARQLRFQGDKKVDSYVRY